MNIIEKIDRYLCEFVNIKYTKSTAMGLTYVGWDIWLQKSTNKRYSWDRMRNDFVEISHKLLKNKELISCSHKIDEYFVDKMFDVINLVHDIIADKMTRINFVVLPDKDFVKLYNNEKIYAMYDNKNLVFRNSMRNEPSLFIHEIGHWIDIIIGDGEKLASSGDGIFKNFNNILKNSALYERLKKDKNFLYLAEKREMFARFYEMFIFHNTGNGIENLPHIYLDKEDFLEANKEFIKILKEKGWK